MRSDLYQKNLFVINSLYRISILVIDYIDVGKVFQAANRNYPSLRKKLPVMKPIHKNQRLYWVNLNAFLIVKYEMSKYTILGNHVFVSVNDMMAKFSNLI